MKNKYKKDKKKERRRKQKKYDDAQNRKVKLYMFRGVFVSVKVSFIFYIIEEIILY